MQTQENSLMNNSVTLIGEVVSDLAYSHEVYGEGFYSFDLQVSRLSNAFDILPVTISERIIESETIAVGKSVEVRGQIRSYNNFVESSKKNKLVLTVFVREVLPFDYSVNKNPNDVSLNGFICKPPVYRTTPFGREICDILLAVNRSYNKSDYIPCIAWGRNAKYSGRLAVGDNIKVWGRMQSRLYQKRLDDGEVVEKTALEISISKLENSEHF